MTTPSLLRLRRFSRAQSGATAIEYALIASGIAGVLIAVILTVGTSVTGMYQAVANAFN